MIIKVLVRIYEKKNWHKIFWHLKAGNGKMPSHILKYICEWNRRSSIRKCCGCFYQHGFIIFLNWRFYWMGSRRSNLLDTSLQIIIITITWGSHLILLCLRSFTYIISVVFFSLTTMIHTAILFSDVTFAVYGVRWPT